MFKDHHGEEKYTYSCGSHLHNRLAYFALVKKRVFSVKAIKKPRFVLLGRKTRNKLNEEYKQMGLEFVKF